MVDEGELKGRIQDLENELRRLKEQNQDLQDFKEEVEELKKRFEEEVLEKYGISRREFLAVVGGGSIGFGSAALLMSELGGEPINQLQYINNDTDNLNTDQIGTDSDRVEDIYASSISTEQINNIESVNSISELSNRIEEIGGDAKYILPSGTFQPSASDLPLDFTGLDNIVVEGAGERSTTIDVSGIESTVFDFDNQGDIRYENAKLKDFMIRGDQTPGSIGVHLGKTSRWNLIDLHIHNLDRGVLVEDASYMGATYNINIDDCRQDGFLAREGSDGNAPNGLSILGESISKHNAGAGWRIEHPNGFNFGSYAEGNGGYGVQLIGVRGASINGAGLENNGAFLDRDRDGDVEQADIGVSPRADTDAESGGIEITGCHFNIGTHDGTAVVLGDAKGVSIENCNFRSSGPGQWALGVNNTISEVSFRDNRFPPNGNVSSIREAVGADVPVATNPNAINGGEWHDRDFGGIGALSEFADNYNKGTSNTLTVYIEDDVNSTDSPVINGADFPSGTVFRSVGTPTLSVDGDVDEVVRLGRTNQKIMGLIIDSSGATGGFGLGVLAASSQGVVRDCHIIGTSQGGDGIRVNDTEMVISGVVFDSGSIAGDDLGIMADNVRVSACEYESISIGGDGVVIDGTSIDRANLGGSDGGINLHDHGPIRYKVRVGAGGSGSNLQGINGPTHEGAEVVIMRTGGENVVLQHNAGVANPLINQFGGNNTLDGNGDTAVYVFDSQNGVWRQTAINTQS